MPDRRLHRGSAPDDDRLFGAAAIPALQSAVADLSWLLGRGYASNSAVKLVGDRYGLEQRQRTAVARASCSEEASRLRTARRVLADTLRGRPLWIDGYNVLITVEAALAGGVLLATRDGALRDMASMHGTFRQVVETEPALRLVGAFCESLGVSECVWLLDRPVSNSGRLKKLMLAIASAEHWNWRVELVADPDPVLEVCSETIATADSSILDHCGAWFNLAREVVAHSLPAAPILSLA